MDVLRVQRVILCSVIALVGASAASAQNVDSIRKSFVIQLPRTIEIAATASRSAPGSSSGSPTAYGANWGDGFIGGGYQDRMRYTKGQPRSKQVDGSVVAGFGLGNSRDAIGIEAAITSFSTFRSGFGHHSGISFKAHRALPGNFGVAVGWENALRTDGTDGGNSIYGVVSSVIKTREKSGDPFSNVTLSAGLGGGRFQTEAATRKGRNGVNGFGSVGIRVLDPVSVIADWSGQNLSLAMSLVPFVRIPLVITPGYADITHSAGDGARFVLGIGMGFRFSKILDVLAPNQ
jgi:hypothetical protein